MSDAQFIHYIEKIRLGEIRRETRNDNSSYFVRNLHIDKGDTLGVFTFHLFGDTEESISMDTGNEAERIQELGSRLDREHTRAVGAEIRVQEVESFLEVEHERAVTAESAISTVENDLVIITKDRNSWKTIAEEGDETERDLHDKIGVERNAKDKFKTQLDDQLAAAARLRNSLANMKKQVGHWSTKFWEQNRLASREAQKNEGLKIELGMLTKKLHNMEEMRMEGKPLDYWISCACDRGQQINALVEKIEHLTKPLSEKCCEIVRNATIRITLDED